MIRPRVGAIMAMSASAFSLSAAVASGATVIDRHTAAEHRVDGGTLCSEFRTSAYNICRGGTVDRGGKLFHYQFRTGDLPATHPTFEDFLHASHSTCFKLVLRWTSSRSQPSDRSYLQIITDKKTTTRRADGGQIGTISAYLPKSHAFLVRVSGNHEGTHMDITGYAQCRTRNGR